MLQKVHASHGEAKSAWRRNAPIVSLAAVALPATLLVSGYNGNDVAQAEPEATSISAPNLAGTRADELDLYQAKKTAEAHRIKPTTLALPGKVATAVCFTIDPSLLHHTEKEFYDNIQLACELAKDEPWAIHNFNAQFGAVVEMWDQESGWDENAINKSSDAGGIPQAMPKSKMGPGAMGNATKQIKWGYRYIDKVYGDPLKAKAFRNVHGWY